MGLAPSSGTKKEPKPKLLSPDIFWWGGGLPREGVGAKKFGMSLETQGIKLFWREIPGFCRDIPEAPEKFCEKNVWVQFSSPTSTAGGPSPPPPLGPLPPTPDWAAPSRTPGALQKEPRGVRGRGRERAGREGLWLEGRVLQLQWGIGGGTLQTQKNVRNPNHHYFSKKYRNTPPICIAIRLQFVLQCFRCPYALRKGKHCQYSSHLYRSTPPICIAIRLPVVSQYFGKILVVVVIGMFPTNTSWGQTHIWGLPSEFFFPSHPNSPPQSE